MGGLRKIVEAHQSDGGCHHVGGIHRVDGNLVALHIEGEGVPDAPSHDAQMGDGVLGSPQAAHDFLTAHLHAGNGRVVDSHDAVAGQYAHLLAGSLGHRLNHEERVLQHVELHPDAFKAARERFVELLGLLGSGVGRMGVQLGKHAVDGILHLLVDVYRVHIEPAYHGCGKHQLLHFLLHGVVVGALLLTRLPLCGQIEKLGLCCHAHHRGQYG